MGVFVFIWALGHMIAPMDHLWEDGCPWWAPLAFVFIWPFALNAWLCGLRVDMKAIREEMKR